MMRRSFTLGCIAGMGQLIAAETAPAPADGFSTSGKFGAFGYEELGLRQDTLLGLTYTW